MRPPFIASLPGEIPGENFDLPCFQRLLSLSLGRYDGSIQDLIHVDLARRVKELGKLAFGQIAGQPRNRAGRTLSAITPALMPARPMPAPLTV